MFGRRWGDRSGVQQRQFAIARALAVKSRVLADWCDMAILVVEQYDDFAQELADHWVVMERGVVVATGLGKDMEPNGMRRLVAI